jgi:DSBA-like thioredoxin domain
MRCSGTAVTSLTRRSSPGLPRPWESRNPQVALSDPKVKERLRENTNWAITRGVFGVPTLVIGEEFFWGHDAMEMAFDYVADPEAFNTPDMRSLDTLPIGVARLQAARPK